MLLSAALSLSCATTTSSRSITQAPNSESHWVSRAGWGGVIIFVHGVFGDADGTWRNANRAYWPEMVARDLDFAFDDVYVVGYNTPKFRRALNIEELAQNELQELDDRGIMKYDRIYFITHSMGGLIVKRILNILDSPSRIADLRRIRAVFLFSTPSRGAPIAKIMEVLGGNQQIGDMIPANFNTFLQSLENDYQEMVRERNHAHEDYPQIFCAYETQPTLRVLIAPLAYTATSCDNTPHAMNCNHSQCVKPRDMNSDPYPWTKARIQDADGLTAARN